MYDLIAEFDGCSGAKAGRIAAEFKKSSCADVDRDRARKLLLLAQVNSREVKPSRFGAVGPDVGLEPHHAKIESYFRLGTTMLASIPFVVEAWANAEGIDDTVGEYMALGTRVWPARSN